MCRSIFRRGFSARRGGGSGAGPPPRCRPPPPTPPDSPKPFELPPAIRLRARVGFFPGSTIGNFEPPEAARFLRHAAALLGRGAHLIVGVDLIKNEALLDAAYNDAAGGTAAFNLNLLR